ncbi:hypothetical protein PC113_g17710 [Phytophthora cactorum]|uniref:Uncharacterized protein n=1 Tax=Phytophthora cactorum TaxID=29920 RepID=A0A8T0YLI7_9STRA|nr:hypothetical protein PC113_g17710 [Phytophthora cactorum]KAG2897704.1 hypothetical protein PC115_g17085 [Phytophthora cactorum]
MTHSNTAEMKAKTLTWRRDRTSKTLESIEAKTNKYCEAATTGDQLQRIVGYMSRVFLLEDSTGLIQR